MWKQIRISVSAVHGFPFRACRHLCWDTGFDSSGVSCTYTESRCYTWDSPTRAGVITEMGINDISLEV